MACPGLFVRALENALLTYESDRNQVSATVIGQRSPVGEAGVKSCDSAVVGLVAGFSCQADAVEGTGSVFVGGERSFHPTLFSPLVAQQIFDDVGSFD